LRIARQAAAANPHNGAILDTLGWVCYRSGRYEEALSHLQKAARLTPKNGLIHYHLGKALWAAGRLSEAAESFRAALSRGLPPEEKREAQAFL
jgi:Flp pilus assembly protein TadD